MRTCVVCGGGMEGRHGLAKSCSTECAAERERQKLREWKKKNPEKIRQQAKRHYWGRRDHILERTKAWRASETGRVKNRERTKRYREKHPEKEAAKRKKWEQENREWIRKRKRTLAEKRSAALKFLIALQAQGLEALL